jgi:hypothetical protein
MSRRRSPGGAPTRVRGGAAHGMSLIGARGQVGPCWSSYTPSEQVPSGLLDPCWTQVLRSHKVKAP